MKQFKPVIITALVLVIVAAAAFAVIKLFPEADDEIGAPVQPDVSSGLNKIIDRSSKDVASVTVTTDSGETFTIDYGEDKLGAQTAVMRNADPLLRYSESEMTTLSGFVGLLVALEEVGELKSGEESMFGFDKPQRKIEIAFKGGDPVTLLIGSETPLGTGVYIRRTDRNIVYTVGGSTTDILMMTMKDYRDIHLYDTIGSADLLTKVTVSRAGKPDITVVRKEETGEAPADQVEASLQCDYALTSPVSRDANPDTINAALLDKVISIKPKAIVEDYPKDLAKYGLTNPVKLQFETSTEISQSLLIGGKTPDGGRYIMQEGVPSVIETEADIDLESLSHADIIMQLIWFYDSDEIDTITYELPGGETHTMSIEIKDKSLKGIYDGKEMVNRNATNMFLRTVRFTIAGEYTSDMKMGERAIKATIKLLSGATTTFELFPINDRQYAASVDGKAPEYYVNVTEVRELLESFEILASGKDIPDMF
ncbi:MAG: DUF4340 domain-containing protein [Oscillospiraceae bacterium]|nr:DUF4340 domain-containing protein [Oscillospiraceae bacterium]